MKDHHLDVLRRTLSGDDGDRYRSVVWRFLSPVTGSGPYREPDSAIPGWLDEQIWDLRERHTDPEHPGWREEGVDVERAFAFAGLDKARAWFEPDLLHTLECTGYWLALLVVADKRATPSGRQVTYNWGVLPLTLGLWRPTVLLRNTSKLTKAEAKAKAVLKAGREEWDAVHHRSPVRGSQQRGDGGWGEAVSPAQDPLCSVRR